MFTRKAQYKKQAKRFGFKPARSKGFTLVELMIAGSLGLIVIGGMYALFTANNKVLRMQSNISQAQEKAIFALEVIAEDARLAGWPGVFDPLGTDPFGSRFDPAGYPLFKDNNNRFDTLVLSRRGRTANPGAADPLLQQNEMDCTGTVIDFNIIDRPLTHRYYVDPLTSTLMCESLISGRTAAIVSNVVGFQVLYGIDMVGGKCDTDMPNLTTKDVNAECMTPTQFVSGNQLEQAFINAAVAHGDNFSQLVPVKALRIAIAVATEETDIVPRDQSMANSHFHLGQQHFGHNYQGLKLDEGRVIKYAVRTIGMRQAFRGP